MAPVDAFKQHGELYHGQVHGAFGRLWPEEATVLQTFGEETKAITIPPEQFDEISAPAPEDEDVAAEGICAQFLLDHRGHPIESPAHVGHSASEPDARSAGQADHRGRSVTSTECNVWRSTRPDSEMRARPSSMSIRLEDGTALARIFHMRVGGTAGKAL